MYSSVCFLEGDVKTLTGTKYLWLFAEENIPEKMVERFAFLKECNLKTARAWAIMMNQLNEDTTGSAVPLSAPAWRRKSSSPVACQYCQTA